MKIGIDISQLAFENTGVANIVKNLVEKMVEEDKENQYVLFYSSLRKNFQFSSVSWRNNFKSQNNVTIKQFKIPPTLLDILWNKLHIFPIEKFIGDIDVFISSDWTQPPSKAKKVTILYDLIVYRYPEETHNQWKFSIKNFLITPNIVASQKRRLKWVKKECDKILCISEATKKDAIRILGIDKEKLAVIYPGL